MIDVKRTILETIKDKINRMRFLGDNNPKSLKKILSLIILDDLYDWSDYLDDSLAVLKKLLELRTDYILCLKDFDIIYMPLEQFYINVNTPQTYYTWKRVWDAPDVFTIEQKIDPGVNPDIHYEDVPYTPDPTCNISITYFGQGELIPASESGKPYIDLNTLTVCEKMNIYINRETGQMYYLDPQTGKWEMVKGEYASTLDWSKIDNRPNIYSGIEHSITDEQNLNVTLKEATYSDGTWNYGELSSDIPVTDSNPNPSENADLNDIL